MTTNLTYARTNMDRATELRNELRALDAKVNAEHRDLTPSERAVIDAHAQEIMDCETRARTFMSMSEHEQQITGGLAGLLDTDSIGDGLRIGLPPLRFSGDQLRNLHEGYMENRQVTETIEQRDAIAVPMAMVPGQQLNPVPLRVEPVRVASFLPVEPTETRQNTYYRETTGSTAAAPVAEGGMKPTSNPVWDDVTVSATKIAHLSNASTEALADFSNFRTIVEGSMIRGLIKAENLQLLLGDGTGENMTGFTATSGILTYAPGSAEARLKSILHGVTMLRKGAAFIEPDTIVLHPDDYEILLLTATTTGELILTQNPAEPGVMRLWGIRIVVTSQITSGVALVANFGASTRVLMRQAPSIMVDPYTLSANNMVRFIAEERLSLAVELPAAICRITFNGAT